MGISARVTTAVPLAGACAAGVYFLPPFAFAACLGVVVTLGAWEWTALAGISAPRKRFLYVAILVALGFALLHLTEFARPIDVALSAMVFWLFALVLVTATQLGRFNLGRWPWLRAATGVPVLLPAWLGLSQLHAGPDGPKQVLFLLILVWCADIAAYFAGRTWGRRRLCPEVSPGKSWEGAWAGVLAGAALGILFAVFRNLSLPTMLRFALLAAVTVAASIVGDLFESMVKRSANVKDSGTLLPGHGGILDRVDSLTAAAPIYLFGLQFAGAQP